VQAGRAELRKALADPAPNVRIAAAHALAKYGLQDDLEGALGLLVDLASLDRNGLYVSLAALNAIDDLDNKAGTKIGAIKALPAKVPSINPRMGEYVGRLLEKILRDLGN